MPKRKEKIVTGLEITDLAAEGKAIGKHEGKVVFVPYAAPGDVVDVRITRSKSSFAEGTVIHYHTMSEDRTEPACTHFGTCGGCKWQHIPYPAQYHFKERLVKDLFQRIGKFEVDEYVPIKSCDEVYHYRNKMEYTFSHKRWLTTEEIKSEDTITDPQGLGFHIPGKFDKVLDIKQCFLMDDRHNALRNAIKQYAIEHEISFFNIYEMTGDLRTMMIRCTVKGEWMLLMQFGTPLEKKLEDLMDYLLETFPFIHTLVYVINQKRNDTFQDLEVEIYKGPGYILEDLGGLEFKISPKSFFQTNSRQAFELYSITKDFAGLKGKELVYDLYTGTGSIACFIAADAGKVIGIEYVEDAIKDAKVNAEWNKIGNTDFYAGDMKKVLNDDFIALHGTPEVIITDPPRAGMDEDVVKKILEIAPQKVVYISCNPATQARDIALMNEQYRVVKSQAVDMFPHTHHVENVVLMMKRDSLA